jgi:hypothetical protein
MLLQYIKPKYQLIFFVLVVLGSVLFSSHRASAAFNDIPACLPQNQAPSASGAAGPCGGGGLNSYFHLSTQPNDGSGNGANIQFTTVKLYRNSAPSTWDDVKVSIDMYGSDCSNKKVYIEYKMLDPNNEQSITNIYDTPSQVGDASCSQLNFTPSSIGGWFVASNIPSHRAANLYVLEVTVRLDSNSATTNLHVKTLSGTRLGYAKNAHAMISNGNIQNRDLNVYQLPFRPECTAFGSSASIRSSLDWVDDDYNTAPSGPENNNLPVNIYKYSDLNPSSAINTPYSNFQYGGHLDVNLQPGYGYKLVFSKVDDGNSIQFDSPFDSVDFDLGCPSTTGTAPSASSCNSVSATDDNGHTVGATRYNTNTYVYVINDHNNKIVDHIVGMGQSWSGSFTPDTKHVRVEVHRKYHASDGSWPEYASSNQTYTCYSATCTLSIQGDGPNGEVIAGHPYTVNGKIINDNYAGNGSVDGYTTYNQPLLPTLNDSGNSNPGTKHLALTIDAANTHATNNPLAIPAGTEGFDGDPNWSDTAPGSPTTINISAYPDYYGSSAIGPPCSGGSAKVYQEFKVTLNARTTLNPTRENPASVNYYTWIDHNYGPPADIVVNWSQGGRQGGSTCSQVVGQTYTSPPTGDVTKADCAPDLVAAGANYCTEIHADYTHGYVGPDGSGDLIGTDTPQTANDCKDIRNEPYVHIFGSDAQAGGGFGAGCTPVKGGIYTYNNTGTLPPSGSGVQIGALAIGPISGFSSALLRGSDPLGPNGATFANDTSGPGNMGGSRCVRDYFSSKPDSATMDTSSGTTLNLSSTGGAQSDKYIKWYKPGGTGTGTLTINGGNITKKVDASIFVEGNLYITNDIKFTQSDWGDIESIPSLVIVVKGGDIRIDPNVKQLDGLFIAQPKGNAGGNIHTCASSGGPITSGLLASCRNQLLVNGAFVAQKVNLLRSFGSLRNSYPGEHLAGSRPGSNADCTDSGPAPVATNDCAAEVFNFGPEMYLAHPSVTPSTGPTKGIYDYITSLSPVL